MSEETAAPARKLVLVDAYSLLFRAYFAGHALATRDGKPTGALFGFANMLFSILRAEKPDAIVVCWDAHAQTVREQQYEAYKAHRPEADPQLKAQLPVARDLVAAFGVPSAEVAGYEADDLIGTLAKKGAKEGYQVVILTGDSDQLQLVGEGITVLMTQRGVSETKAYDAAAVRERYGVGPEGIPDWKALVGDTSDNIPGVPGIGEKTATALLQQWETLENLLENLDRVTPAKAKAALEANREQARFSKQLATIICDVPADLPILPYAPTEEDWQRLRQMFIDLEFRSLLARIPPPQTVEGMSPVAARENLSPEATLAVQVVQIGTPAELEAALAAVRASGQAAIQLHTDTSVPMRAQLFGIAFAPTPEIGYYVATHIEEGRAEALGGLFGANVIGYAGEVAKQEASAVYRVPLAVLRPLLAAPEIAKFAHNAKFAEIVLDRHGLRPTPFVYDTQVGAYLLDAGRSTYPLLDLAERYLNARLETDAYTPEETLAREAALIGALVPPLRARIAELGMAEVMERVEMPLIPVLADIEQAGILVDENYLSNLSLRMSGEIETLAQTIYALAGEEFNIGSTKQLQTILFEKLKLPTGKKTKTGFSTGADLLEQLAAEHEIARKILEYREVAKLKSTYADALPKLINPQTGRIHTSLNQTVAATGRLSSSDPNLQNIPVRSEIGREIRRAFIAPRGKVLLSCDYSQIELRILAHVAQDPTLLQAFREDADIHAATAATVFGVPLAEVTPDQRRQAKTINFAVIYGQSGFSLAQTLGVDTAVAKAWIEDYFARLPGVKRYIEQTIALAHAQRYVTTLMGRRRYLPELDSGNHNMRQFAERAAVNMPIQGTAADIMKLAMIAVQDYLKSEQDGRCTLLLQVHDELLFEVEARRVHQITPKLIERMEAAYQLDVRLRVDAKFGPNWTDMKPVV